MGENVRLEQFFNRSFDFGRYTMIPHSRFDSDVDEFTILEALNSIERGF